MSFADEVRAELYEIPVKRPCCRRALAAGLLVNAMETDGGVIVRYPSAAVAGYAESALRAQLGHTLAFERSALARGACALTFSSPAALKLLHLLHGEDAAHLIEPCDSCRSRFLQGLFLASGTVNDPRRSLHLEFLIRVSESVESITRLLCAFGYPPRSVERAGGVGLYYKDGASLEDLLTICGAGNLAMEVMNVRFERQLRGEENRATNCLTQNISKTVSAAVKQVDAIRSLRKSGRLGQLPEGVRLTAQLREENPEASLEELRAMHTPPLTKSGLNHRLKRILDEAEMEK